MIFLAGFFIGFLVGFAIAAVLAVGDDEAEMMIMNALMETERLRRRVEELETRNHNTEENNERQGRDDLQDRRL